jgi:hypothetical protein
MDPQTMLLGSSILGRAAGSSTASRAQSTGYQSVGGMSAPFNVGGQATRAGTLGGSLAEIAPWLALALIGFALLRR